PWAVTSPSENNKYDQGVITAMHFIDKEEITRDFVSQYYSADEPFYKNLFETAVTRPVSAIIQKAKMHLLIVANTEDADIGVTCELDKKNTLKLFKELCSPEMLNIGLETTVIDGDNFGKQKVDAALAALNPAPQDIVIFYYSGHGFNWNKETRQFPYLDLRDKMSQQLTAAYTMNVEDIYSQLLKKGARMNLVLSDCCNADPSQNTVLVSGGASQRTTSLGWVPQKCRDLFMSEKPVNLLMTAASKGELSAGTRENGGIFTYMFRETLGKFMGPYETVTSWAAIVDNAAKRTVKKADGTDCRQPDDSYKPCKQQPKVVLANR
ncbi:MAG: caspase family protein, partial [Flavihumibacter sp.]|nr:caspase family protein [Flavihumibacter sp.]